MNTYIIEHEIIVLLDNLKIDGQKAITKFYIDGIEFSHWDFSYGRGTLGDKWLAKAEIESENFLDARNIYFKKLSKIIPKISLIGQAYIDSQTGSVLIKKGNKGYFYHIFNDNSVSLPFGKTQQNILMNLMQNNNISEAFYYYWNDIVNTQGYSGKITLLCSAIESLLPEKINNPKQDQQKRNLERRELRRRILGDELDNELFKPNTGLRHRLIHGEYFSPEDFQKDYVKEVHKQVIKYFNNEIITIDEKISLDIVNPQRHFYSNYKQGGGFLDLKENISLKQILSEIKNNDLSTLKSGKGIGKPENF